MKDWKPDIMLYHAHCADGFGAAWAAWMRWRDEVEYLPVAYGQPEPDVTGKHVLIGDFSFRRDVMRELGVRAASVVVLDHHKTAQAELSDWDADDPDICPENVSAHIRRIDDHVGQPIAALFDMDRSGASLVWEFCHPQEAPALITLIEDRDLWRFQHPDTRPFGLWLRSEPFDFERWELISQELHDGHGRHRIMAEAHAMERLFDRQVWEIATLARTGIIAGHEVPICNCPPQFASEVGHWLLSHNANAPFVGCYSDQGKARGWSLRSEDHRIDVSEIASKFGGGGHRNAAGFGVPIV